MNWLIALLVTAAIAALAYYLSRWMEKKNFEQQQELIERKKARLQASAKESDVKSIEETESEQRIESDAEQKKVSDDSETA